MEEKSVDAERTVLCLCRCKENEDDILNHIKTKLGLAFRQRTERLMSCEESRNFAQEIVKLMEHDEIDVTVPDLEMDGKTEETKEEGKVDEEEMEIELEKARQLKEKEDQRQEKYKILQWRLEQACMKNELVVLSFLGGNSIRILESALRADQELMNMLDISEKDAKEWEPKYAKEFPPPVASPRKDAKKGGTKGKEVPPPATSQEVDHEREAPNDIEDPYHPTSKWNAFAPFSKESAQVFLAEFFTPRHLGELSFDGEERKFSTWKTVEKTSGMLINEIVDFVFPKSQFHPWSTGRMLVLGEYGPLDTTGKIRGGIRASYSMNRHEIDTIIKQINMKDLLSIYVGDELLTSEEEVEVVKQADPKIRNDKQLTKGDVIAIFENLPEREDGRIAFHHIQNAIFKFRLERIERWKQIATNGVRHQKKSKSDLQAAARHQRAIKIASREGRQSLPKLDDKDSFLVTSKLLNRHSFQVCQLEDKNDPSIVQNVRILRPAKSNAVKHGAYAWKD